MGYCEGQGERGIEMTDSSEIICNSAPKGQGGSQDKPMKGDGSVTESPLSCRNSHPFRI